MYFFRMLQPVTHLPCVKWLLKNIFNLKLFTPSLLYTSFHPPSVELFTSFSPCVRPCLYCRPTAAHFEAAYVRLHFGSTSPHGHTHTQMHARTPHLHILIQSYTRCSRNGHIKKWKRESVLAVFCVNAPIELYLCSCVWHQGVDGVFFILFTALLCVPI